MTVAVQSPKTEYIPGDGVNKNFPFNFRADEITELKVVVRDNNTLDEIEYTSNFSSTGLGDSGGGVVTFPSAGSAISSDYSVAVERIVPYSQGVQLSGQGGFNPSVVERGMDKLSMQVQQINNKNEELDTRVDNAIAELTKESNDNVIAAQASAASALDSKNSAAADAASALANRLITDSNVGATNADAANTHSDMLLAGLSADAALLNAVIYPDEPTGRAAVADGVYFKVIGNINGDECIKIYKRLNAGASEQRRSFPSYEYLAGLAAILRPDSALRIGTEMAALLKRKTGYLWVANDRSSVFSDAGATTLANVGDYCPVWQDLSGRSNHFTKHASYNAPVLKEDVYGIRYLEFIGAAEDRTLKAANGGNTATMFGGFAIRAQSAIGTVQQILVAADATTSGWVLGQNNTGTRFEVRNAGGTTFVTDNVANIIPGYEATKVGEILVSSGGYDGTRAFKWKNGHRRMNSVASYVQKASGEVWLCHNIQNTVGEATTHLYATCLFTENLTYKEQKVVNDYLASLVPIHGRPTNVLSIVKNKIELGAGDTTIIHLSDSTGDAEEEEGYMTAAWFAELYPTTTVEYTSADYTNNTMFATVTLNVGTNGRKIKFYNFAQSGGVARRYLADRYPLITALGSADLLIMNMGKNIASSNPDEVVRGEFLAAIEQIRATYPTIGVCAILQPPNMLDDEEENIYRVIKGIMADWRELYLINAADVWKARGRRQSDYADWTTNGIHPVNGDIFFKNGSCVTVEVFKEEYRLASVIAGTVGNLMLATTTAGLISNPKFASWAGAVPDNWVVGSGAVTKDTVNFAPGNTYSLKITGAGSEVHNTFDATSITSFTVYGKTMASPTDIDSGSIEIQWLDALGAVVGNTISSTGDGGNATSSHSGAFCNTMICGSPKPVGATQLRIRLRGGVTGGWFNDISTCAGNKPMSLV